MRVLDIIDYAEKLSLVLLGIRPIGNMQVKFSSSLS